MRRITPGAGMSGWLPLRDVPETAARLDKSGVSVVSGAVAAVLPSHAPTLPASQKKAPEPKKTPASQEARSPAEAPNPEPADTAPEPVERKPEAPPQPAWAKRRSPMKRRRQRRLNPPIRNPSTTSHPCRRLVRRRACS